MNQFVLLEGLVVMKVVLKFAVMEPGVLSVMVTGIILMLVLSVDS